MLRTPTSHILLGVIFLAAVAFVVAVKADPTQKEEPKNAAARSDPSSKDTPAILAPSTYWIGLRVVPVPDILLPQFGVKEDGGGLVVVEQVIQGAPADKAGVERGDVILRFGDTEIHSLFDLVSCVDAAQDSEQEIQLVREGVRKTLKVTPESRPASTVGMSGYPLGMSGFSRQLPPGFRQKVQTMPHSGMSLGPEIWLGSRDPQQMMKEMEEYFRQMQGGSDDQQLLVQPDREPLEAGMAEQFEVSSATDRDGKRSIRVKQYLKSGDRVEEKNWEADNIEDLPEEIRGKIEKMFGKQ